MTALNFSFKCSDIGENGGAVLKIVVHGHGVIQSRVFDFVFVGGEETREIGDCTHRIGNVASMEER